MFLLQTTYPTLVVMHVIAPSHQRWGFCSAKPTSPTLQLGLRHHLLSEEY